MPSATPSLRSLALPATIRAAAALSSGNVAIGARLAVEHRLQRHRIGIGVAAFQRIAADAAKTGVLRRHLEAADIAVLECCDKGRAGEGDLVEPVRAVHHPDRLRAEVLQDLRQRLHPLPREHADHLPLDAGRIGERTEQVEDRSRRELGPGRTDILHRGMMRGREHEADAGFLDAAADLLGPQIDLHAERGQHVGGARARRQRAVAVLGDGDAQCLRR